VHKLALLHFLIDLITFNLDGSSGRLCEAW